MAIDDDPLLIRVRQVQDDSSEALDISQSIVSTVANVMLPGHIGEYLTGVLGVVSQKRWNQRTAELLRYFAEDVVRLKYQIRDQSYYASEEFQALIYEAFDQERTNRFEEKRRMLALGLASSGTERFVEDSNKEMYMRCLRDLRVSDVKRMIGIRNVCSRPVTAGAKMRQVDGFVTDSEMADDSFRRLEGLGLIKSTMRVERKQIRSRRAEQMSEQITDIIDALNTIINEQRSTVFTPTRFGLGFLDFVIGQDAMKAAQD